VLELGVLVACVLVSVVALPFAREVAFRSPRKAAIFGLETLLVGLLVVAVAVIGHVASGKDLFDLLFMRRASGFARMYPFGLVLAAFGMGFAAVGGVGLLWRRRGKAM
jgi:hypothetical protein